MRKMIWAVLAIGLVLSQQPTRAEDAKAPEKATYKITSVIVDGMPIPADQLKDWRLITDGNKYVVKMGDTTVEEGTAKVDMTKKPWHIERTPTSGMDKGKTSLGILKVDGNKSTVCWALAGKPRPKDFTSKKGSGYILETLEKVAK